MKKLLGLILLAAPLTHADSIDELAAELQGRFDTHAPGQESDLPVEQRLIDSRQRPNTK